MSILSCDTNLDDALHSLQADRALLTSIAQTLQEPASNYDVSQFVIVDERVHRQMESLACRLAASEDR